MNIYLPSIEFLPDPVQKYFKNVLGKNTQMLNSVYLQQRGVLRKSPTSKKWMKFSADHYISAREPEFKWDADIRIAPFFSIKVTDSYKASKGMSEVGLFNRVIQKSEGGVEMNSRSLHRYLAEAVWYPTALLPQNGIKWTPISDESALATLTHAETTVSLEFRFNEQGEVVGIFTPARWGTFGKGFKQTPWQGYFSDYYSVGGFKIPRHGEVGWFDSGHWVSVWQGEIINADFKF